MIYLFLALLIIYIIFKIVISKPVFGGTPSGERLVKMKNSPQFKNGQFFNQRPTPQFAEGHSMPRVMYNFFFTKKDPLLKPKIPIPVIKTDLKNLPQDEDVFIWLGHSSYFIRLNALNFLIDPLLSDFGAPFRFFNKAFDSSEKYSPEDLPMIDYLVITHDHYDHLDYPTIKSIKNLVKNVIVPLGVGAHFEKWGYQIKIIIEEDWGTEVMLENNCKITFTAARHFSGRKMARNNTLWASYVLESSGLKLFLGGDSGYDSHFKKIGERFGPFDFAILENGQYNVAWKYIHALPEEVVQAAKDLQTKYFIPVHSGKFALALHPWNEPLEKVTELAERQHQIAITPKIGDVLYLTQKSFTSTKWWR